MSDHERRELFSAAERQWGSGPAATLMELLPPVGWADVARQSDLVAVRGEIAELRGELKGEMAELRGEVAELRGEVHGLFGRLLAANVAAMAALVGLTLAVASFVK